ncbi:hypothetical protein CC1G_07365 [Coprinopsis cinerea okayama7|uniref:Uncharacterized protein n=1 Tax=Coprinopsis cinerea (strain Okayama-7 / 130 / ATCC MYA-4618 / FGSC 9003) TaxID=240176 RepID=A8N6J4_COPC7|nr:hypothetical protein CC1G_07365 [Coprinopsis cinerea okayama7\|eukprot:XP_001830450.2 hypothetical protein CC1G_07365 [Coprinopsis cinerea okayama7\
MQRQTRNIIQLASTPARQRGALTVANQGQLTNHLRRYNSSLTSLRWKQLLVPSIFRGAGLGIGIAVGICVVVGAQYHYSGWKEKVETAHKTLELLNKAASGTERDHDGQKKPSQLLNLAREAVKTYLAGVPLSGAVVDLAFDSVDSAIDAHGAEATAIISRMAKEIEYTIDAHKTWSTAAARDIYGIVNRETKKLRELAGKPETQEAIQSVKHAAAEKAQTGIQQAKAWGSQAGGFVASKWSSRPSKESGSDIPKDDFNKP